MKKHNIIPQRSNGFSLVEMLIAMSIGITLISGILQVLSSSTRMFNHQEQLSLLLENGRFTTDYLGGMLRQAGFVNVGGVIATPLTGTDGVGETSDSVTVQYDSLADSVTDCLGNVGAGIQNLFFIQGDVTNLDKNNNPIPSLFCTSTLGGVSSTQAIISNISNMQISYGVDSDADGVANQYQVASAVPNFANVVTLRIGFLTVASSATRTSPDNTNNPPPYNLAGQTIARTNDLFLRRAFNVTIQLRN